MSDVSDTVPVTPPSLWEIFREFLLIGAVSFGGGSPTAHREAETAKAHRG